VSVGIYTRSGGEISAASGYFGGALRGGDYLFGAQKTIQLCHIKREEKSLLVREKKPEEDRILWIYPPAKA
jgi:hypothetical protein